MNGERKSLMDSIYEAKEKIQRKRRTQRKDCYRASTPGRIKGRQASRWREAVSHLQDRLKELEAALACADGGLAAEAFLVLDLIVAEFESDLMSTQCFDGLTVERAKGCIREYKRLGRTSKLEDWKRIQQLEDIERRYQAIASWAFRGAEDSRLMERLNNGIYRIWNRGTTANWEGETIESVIDAANEGKS